MCNITVAFVELVSQWKVVAGESHRKLKHFNHPYMSMNLHRFHLQGVLSYSQLKFPHDFFWKWSTSAFHTMMESTGSART